MSAHLFEGWLDGCHDGRIELAWTDARDGKLKHAAIFGTDELDQLVERALAENRNPGQNVYIGQALRKPGVAPFGRCKDDEFLALTAFYADIDDDVTATATINYRHRGCSADRCGHHRPASACPRADAVASQGAGPRCGGCRRQNLALAEALGGDTAVVNPSRVMRLGGSIAGRQTRPRHRTHRVPRLRRRTSEGLSRGADRESISAGAAIIVCGIFEC